MKKIPPYITFLLLLFIILLLLINLFVPEQRAWMHTRAQTKGISKHMDSTQMQLQKTSLLIDSLRSELNHYSRNMLDLEKKLEIIERDRKSGQEKFSRESARLKERLNEINSKYDSNTVKQVTIE